MIKFGPAGNESSFYDEGNRHTYQAMKWLSDMGLNAYEYQAGRGVRLKEESGLKIKEEAQKYGINLSLHAPYYINTASLEAEKLENTKRYLYESYLAAKYIGARRICFHPGSFKGDTREGAIKRASSFLKSFLDDLNDLSIVYCPELMGKINQLGNLEEIIYLCAKDERLLPTIDFGHLNARTYGSLKTSNDFEKVILTLINGIGLERSRKIHIHFSQIEYTKGGEKKHLTFSDQEYGPFFENLVPILYKYEMTPYIICESADKMAQDALRCKKLYEQYDKKDVTR